MKCRVIWWQKEVEQIQAEAIELREAEVPGIELLEKESGIKKGLFESNEGYKNKAENEILMQKTGLRKGFFESDKDYQKRARKELSRQISDE